MDPLWTAWLAGLYEGEGSLFGFSNSRTAGALRIGMTDEDVIHRCREVMGVGHVTGPREQRPPRKPIWTWSVYQRSDLLMVVEAILPYLGERRRQRVIEVRQRLVLGDGRRRPVEHGTRRGYDRHYRERTPLCEPCRQRLRLDSAAKRERARNDRSATEGRVVG